MPELPDLSRAKALEPLVDRLAELKSPAPVAIDGPDPAGKTTLGQELATLIAERGRTADRISADDFSGRRRTGTGAVASRRRATTQTPSISPRFGPR